MHRIEAQQMSIGFHRAQIVDCDDLNIVAVLFDDRAQDISANPPKPVDCNFNGHLNSPRNLM